MRRRRVTNAGRITVIILVGLLLAIPLFYLLSGSLMSATEIGRAPRPLLPSTPIWQNFSAAWAYLTPRAILNSFVFTAGVILLQLAVSLPAAFALSQMRFRWTAPVIAILLVPMFVPASLTLIPTFVIAFQLGWLNTFAGLIVPIAAQCAFAILLFRQYFANMPPGLVEAARLDGASWMRVLVSVAVPLARPALATYISVTFLTAWNMYVWPQVIAPQPEVQVINVVLAPLGRGAIYLSEISPAVGLAAAVLAILPVLAVFIIFQRWFVKGFAGTGLE